MCTFFLFSKHLWSFAEVLLFHCQLDVLPTAWANLQELGSGRCFSQKKYEWSHGDCIYFTGFQEPLSNYRRLPDLVDALLSRCPELFPSFTMPQLDVLQLSGWPTGWFNFCLSVSIETSFVYRLCPLNMYAIFVTMQEICTTAIGQLKQRLPHWN